MRAPLLHPAVLGWRRGGGASARTSLVATHGSVTLRRTRPSRPKKDARAGGEKDGRTPRSALGGIDPPRPSRFFHALRQGQGCLPVPRTPSCGTALPASIGIGQGCGPPPRGCARKRRALAPSRLFCDPLCFIHFCAPVPHFSFGPSGSAGRSRSRAWPSSPLSRAVVTGRSAIPMRFKTPYSVLTRSQIE
jgi:hypothetical protein